MGAGEVIESVGDISGTIATVYISGFRDFCPRQSVKSRCQVHEVENRTVAVAFVPETLRVIESVFDPFISELTLTSRARESACVAARVMRAVVPATPENDPDPAGMVSGVCPVYAGGVTTSESSVGDGGGTTVIVSGSKWRPPEVNLNICECESGPVV